MNRKFIIYLMSVLTLLSGLTISASESAFSRCFICMSMEEFHNSVDSNKPVCFPIAGIAFDFTGYGCYEGTVDGAKAILYSGDEIIANGIISAWTSRAEVVPAESYVTVEFESPLTLPKGRNYKLVVPKGSVHSLNDPSLLNEEFSVEFEVPESLDAPLASVSEGSEVVGLQQFSFDFGVETSLAEGAEATIYMNEAPLKRFPVIFTGADTRCVGFDMGKNVNFKKGEKYYVRISGGNIFAKYRHDIANEPVELNFVGGYTGNVPSMDFESYRLDGDSGANFIGKVMFVYKTPVALTIEPSVQLTEDGNMIKEVVPTLAQEDGKWVMTADFENTYMNPDKEYSVIIPESTLVTAGADVFVNSREVVKIGGTTGITEVADGEFAVTAENGVVTVGNIVEGSEVKLYTLDGKTVYSSIASEKVISIPAPATGVYILSAGGKTGKISVK